uniref:PSP domain-containing protein n=1 Tax=Heterorhabditis bacteriophora TaxID=37862 RepID=A0A1I7XQE9_HETBA
MKQLRFGGFRPARRSRGGRDEICQEMFPGEGPPPQFFGQPPMGFFCDPYAGGDRGPIPPLPPFTMPPPDAPHPMVHDGFTERTSPMNGGLPGGMISTEFESELGFQPLPSMYPPELKAHPMAGW